MTALAERYGAERLAVMVFKPDSSHQLGSYPTREQIYKVSDQIREYKGDVLISPEVCYSQMCALVKRSFFGSFNYGVFRGCGAGRDGISVTVEGRLTPCRHLEAEEEFDHIMDYWQHSSFLEKLRAVEENRREPCKGCKWEQNCLPCMAVGLKLHGELNYGMKECPIAEPL
jgi:pyrroloquinoline quinone biosynthesis protein E